MSSAHITYTPRSDADKEGELDALAAVYAFVLKAYAKEKAAAPSGLDNDAKEVKYDRIEESIPR